ncbi:MAG: hypothetical protein J6K92_06275 [Oscillospiraceae bacterium]|nr:hypothetical protein [Oscillospiraceae bacterium]
MKKKISAVCAAILISASMFSGCGNNKVEETPAETSINIIQDGTEAPSPEESSSSETEFVDPGANIDFGGNNASSDIPDIPDFPENADTEATLPDNHDEIVNMIEGGIVTEKAPVITEYNVDFKTRYGYNTLNDQEKALYADILEAAKSVKTKVKVDESVTDEMWLKVYGCLYMQEPQLFWLASKGVTKGKLRYWEVDPDLIASMQKEIEKNAAEVLAKADGKDTFGKLKVFHDYITLNNNFVKEEGFNQTIYGGFVNGEIQCEGYAKTMQYLCDMSGIESVVVVGSIESNDSHAWNVVKVDGDWYNLDCTWDDPILKEVDETTLRYRYFLVPDEWIHNKSHFNVNTKVSGTQIKYFDPPKCTATKMNYFNVSGELYSDKASAESALKDKLKSYAANKMRAVEIRVASKDVYDAITGNLKEYASWIKSENSSVSSVASNCDPNTLVIELDLNY